MDGDSNPNTGLWAYTESNSGSYFGDPSGTFRPTVPIVSNNSGSSADVPGPLPALGLAVAFSFSRQLRKRIKASTTGVSSITSS